MPFTIACKKPAAPYTASAATTQRTLRTQLERLDAVIRQRITPAITTPTAMIPVEVRVSICQFFLVTITSAARATTGVSKSSPSALAV